MLDLFASWLLPLLLFLFSASLVSLSWRQRGMTFHRLWFPSQAPRPVSSSASSPTQHHQDRRTGVDRRQQERRSTIDGELNVAPGWYF